MNNKQGIAPEDVARIQGMLDENLASIRRLNDELRTRRLGGTIVVTPGIAGLGAHLIKQIFDGVAGFEDFNSENDPYGEHDCGVMEIAGIKVIWKIDYFDKQRLYHSDDAADPNVTVRVMTVMRADEY